MMEDQEEDMLGTGQDWGAICNDAVREELKLDAPAAVSEPQAVYSGSPIYRDNLLLRETFDLSVAAIKYVNATGLGRGWLVDQFERSACSPGANSKEAQNAESLKDFIHKLKIALKEADEAEYWYYVIAATHDNATNEELISRIQRVMRILNKIISTSKQRLVERKRTSPPSVDPAAPSANPPIS